MTITRRGFLTATMGSAIALAGAAAPALACPEPVLTRGALLTGKDFIAEGFAWCKVYDGFEGDAGLDMGEVAARPVVQFRGYRELVARLYTGRTTAAAQEVALFDTAAHAHAFVVSRSRSIDQGADVTGGAWKVVARHRPKISGASEATWWHVHNTLSDPRSNMVVGLARRGPRVAVLRMSALESDPGTTMDTPGLLHRAVHRMAD